MNRKTEALLTEMVEEAKAHVPRELIAPAVLRAWAALRGKDRWTRGMVSSVERVMRLAAMLAIAVAMARGATVTVRETRVTGPDPAGRATGTLTITATRAFTSVNGTRVETVSKVAKVINGAFSVTLEPNISGTAYKVQYDLDGGKPRTEFWVVTAGLLSPASVDAVLATPVTDAGRVLLAQITPGGAGTFCLMSVDGVVSWSACAAGSGGGLFDSATGLFDSATGLFDAH